MKKLTTLFAALFLISTFVLAGCGSGNSKVSDGVNSMLDTTKQISDAINSGDQAKVKEVGPKLEDQWKGFEDEVKKLDKNSYEQIEKYLDPTIAGSQAPKLDKEALGTLNNQLSDALKELQKKAK
ncbi:hypothetical protein ACQYAD_08175 [Neobacillus sp. SM06]|uniref:hypothetical protein n=1 Tax=Neobacillus sp. SM06 TaxID=3422492 RepID=UPI003D2CE94C